MDIYGKFFHSIYFSPKINYFLQFGKENTKNKLSLRVNIHRTSWENKWCPKSGEWLFYKIYTPRTCKKVSCLVLIKFSSRSILLLLLLLFKIKQQKPTPLKGVFAKNERGYRLSTIKKTVLIATNLTSIFCVYKEKIVKKQLIPNNLAVIQIEKIATYDLDRNKTQFNFKQIIQILQPIVIDYLSPNLFKVYIYNIF